jgi:plastocyanin
MEQETNSSGGYGKRPVWQWVLLYVVIGGIVYAGVYYFIINKNGSGYTTNTPYTAPSTQTPTPTTTTPQSVTVNIQNFAFNPATLTIKTGTKVTWTNNDSVAHTVTSDSGGLLNSGTIAPGQSFSFTFNSPGSTSYHCSIHPMMKGQVTVTN